MAFMPDGLEKSYLHGRRCKKFKIEARKFQQDKFVLHGLTEIEKSKSNCTTPKYKNNYITE